jgi:hypothetical protein
VLSTLHKAVILISEFYNIINCKGDFKGLKGFFECDLEGKRTTRSSVKGDLLPPTMKNIP